MVRSSGLTAWRSPNFFSTCRSSIVDIIVSHFLSKYLLADGAKGDATQQVIPQHERDDRHGDQETQASSSDRRPFQTTASKHGGYTGRSSAGFLAGEHQRKSVLIPGKDQAKDRCRSDPGHCLGQDNLEKCL